MARASMTDSEVSKRSAAAPLRKRVVIVGATGMVGGHALRYALEHPGIERVTSIGRRKLGMSHARLEEVLHGDFSDCSPLESSLTGQDAAIFCLGAYTGVVTDAELRKVTVAYVIEFARVLRGSSPLATFCLLSGGGADRSGRSRMAFARYKGEAESALLAAGFPAVHFFRPAYIYPTAPRTEPTLGYRVLRWMYPAFRWLAPGQVIRADDLARVMVEVAVRGASELRGTVFENRDIQAMVKQLAADTD